MTTQAAALDATVAADRANVQSAKVQLDYATIEAPISGRTGLLQVHKGNLVRANDTAPIVSINRITPVYVTFAIPESMLPQFKKYMAGGHDSGRGAGAQRRRPAARSARSTSSTSRSTRPPARSRSKAPSRTTRSPPDAGPVRQRQRDADHRPERDRGADRRRCRAASRATSSSSSRTTRPSRLRPVTVARTHGDDSIINDRRRSRARRSSPTASCGWCRAAGCDQGRRSQGTS